MPAPRSTCEPWYVIHSETRFDVLRLLRTAIDAGFAVISPRNRMDAQIAPRGPSSEPHEVCNVRTANRVLAALESAQ